MVRPSSPPQASLRHRLKPLRSPPLSPAAAASASASASPSTVMERKSACEPLPKGSAASLQSCIEIDQRSGNLAESSSQACLDSHRKVVQESRGGGDDAHQESHGNIVQQETGHGDQVDQKSHGNVVPETRLSSEVDRGRVSDIVSDDLQENVADDEKPCSTCNGSTLERCDGTGSHQLNNLMQINHPNAAGNTFSNSCGRQRLQRHWMETGGNVCIPEIWGREQYLGDWVSYGIVEDALRPAGLMAARAALINTDLRRRRDLLLSSSPSSPPSSAAAAAAAAASSPDTRSSPSPSPRRPLVTANVGAS